MRHGRDISRLLRRLDSSSRPATPAVLTYLRGLPRRAGESQPMGRPPVTLEEAVAGEEVVVPGVGRAFRVDSRADAPRELPGGGDGLLYFDIEATGLTSAPLFLIGLMRASGPTLLLRQLLARNYAEEATVLSLFAEEARFASRLVSFNGKSYDLPFIRSRAVLYRISLDLPAAHTDLLHAARRTWGFRLPDCRLQTLERRILGDPRPPDIPGGEIPDAYHAFVRTGDAREIAVILEHNRRDLVSLAHLLSRLP